MEIYGFMHVAMMGEWQAIVAEQLLKLRASGLYDKTAKLRVGIVGGSAEEFPFADNKIEVAYASPRLKDAEFATLSLVEAQARQEPSLVYYLHTKGVSHENPCVSDWRRLMEHFLILRHEDCVRALASHDICGVDWLRRPEPHFSGNFWWARSEYVRRLPSLRAWLRPDGWDFANRHACEWWIGMGASPRVACLHSSPIDHYRDLYPRSRYAQLREVRPHPAMDVASAWKGLENRFQDLIEPIGNVSRVVEIGVEFGYSLFAFAQAMPQATILGVDPYEHVIADEDGATTESQGAWRGSCEAERWVQEHLVNYPNVWLLRTTGTQAAKTISAPLDVVHIDSIHSYRAVAEDFAAWEPLLRLGGCVLFHDTVSYREDVGKFFHDLPGRKAEIVDYPGLGAWYKSLAAESNA